MIRNANMLGIAREIAAVTGAALRMPDKALPAGGPAIEGQASIQITNPELNPRFVLGLIRGVEPRESPYWVQRRLRLAGMRPINSVVDATNYVMLSIGQPLHAFDYDQLAARAGGNAPVIITRTASAGEKLTTLDGVERALNEFTVLVCDTAGALSIAGVMGGADTEVTSETRNVLLEGANWNYINIRRTTAAQKLSSEAGWRFARGIHPALAQDGVELGLKCMLDWGGGTVASGLVDEYPMPPRQPEVRLTEQDVHRLLGIQRSAQEIAGLLGRLEFVCRVEGDAVLAAAPPFRMDIGEDVVGVADVVEEVARMVGYDRIPVTRMRDVLPQQRGNPALEKEERVRDGLVSLGIQEVINYRLTAPEREALTLPKGGPAIPSEDAYIRLKNPMSTDRAVMRRSMLSAVLDTLEHNARLRDRLAIFEIGPIFLPTQEGRLPEEPTRLGVAMTGLRQRPAWDTTTKTAMDFFDLKGVIDALLEMLHVSAVRYEPANHPSFHPGKCARVLAGETDLGVIGELHPLVKENYDFGAAPVLAADLDMDALCGCIPQHYGTQPVPVHPPVLEDIAVVVDDTVPAAQVEAVIRQAGGKMLADVRLFDVFRSPSLGEGKKSLAYALTYQAEERTLTDTDAAAIRQKIIRRLEQETSARLRS
jgi:phenylalanyl-tRNA synthetase beta chain